MSIPVIENWAEIIGLVESVDDEEPDSTHRNVRLFVESISDVDDFPNLFDKEAIVGSILQVLFSNTVFSESQMPIATGKRIQCRVRRVTHTFNYVNPSHIRVLD